MKTNFGGVKNKPNFQQYLTREKDGKSVLLGPSKAWGRS